jgi:uncharacterized protein YgbK (DUF1537 family)
LSRKRPRIGVIADDLTGAGDAGLAFFESGFTVETALIDARGRFPSTPQKSTDVWVLDTESRHLNPLAAARRVRQAAARLKKWRASFIYKKIDSTLRGNLKSETAAFLAALPAASRPLVFAPAFPALGRATLSETHFVDGKLLHETAFARDPLSPLKTSSIEKLLGPRNARRLAIPNVLSQKDLTALARRILSGRGVHPRAAIGSGGLAATLASALRLNNLPLPPSEGEGRDGGASLYVVAGSANPVSRRQLKALNRAKIKNVAIFSTPARRGHPQKLMDRLMANVRKNMSKRPARLFVVTGGETAARLCRLLGGRRLSIAGKIAPGVPVCAILPEKNAPKASNKYKMDEVARIVMKPGGFGKEDVLIRSVARLQRPS